MYYAVNLNPKYLLEILTSLRSSGWQIWRDFFFKLCHSDRATERSDEESIVYTPQLNWTRSIYWRSSRHSLTLNPQDDGFKRLIAPSKNTRFELPFPNHVIPNGSGHSERQWTDDIPYRLPFPTIPSFRQSDLKERRGIYSQYLAVKLNSKFKWRSSRQGFRPSSGWRV